MQENLKAIRAGLQKVEAITTRRQQLETEQRELQAKIQKLTSEVAAGNADAVADLTIAKARLESALPADLTRCQAEHAAVVSELRSGLATIGPVVARAYSAKYEEVQASVAEFLAQHMDDGHECQELTRQITNNSRPVRSLESLRTIFHSSALIAGMSSDAVVSRCRHAMKDLAGVI